MATYASPNALEPTHDSGDHSPSPGETVRDGIHDGIESMKEAVADAVDGVKSALGVEDTAPDVSREAVAALTQVYPEFFGASQRGADKEHNEDNYLIAELDRTLRVAQASAFSLDRRRTLGRAQGWLLAISDGGAHDGEGALASQVAVNTMADFAFNEMPWGDIPPGDPAPELAQGFRVAVRAAESNLRRTARERDLDSVPETTLTSAYIAWPNVYVAHVGNSRAYLMRDGELHRLTLDHVAPSRGERGDREREQVSELTNALGGPSARVRTELRHAVLQVDDILMVCSDGVTATLDDARLADHLRGLLEGETAHVADLVRAIVDDAATAGGADDMTVAIARFRDGADRH